MVTISAEVTGLPRAIQIFERIGLVVHDRTAILSVVTTMIRAQALRRFASKTDPDGNAWPPYAESTIASGRGGNLLIKSGRLMGSITQQVSGDVGVVKTNVEYAIYHHTGSQKVPNHPPKRQFLGVGKQDVDEIQRAVEAFIIAHIG